MDFLSFASFLQLERSAPLQAGFFLASADLQPSASMDGPFGFKVEFGKGADDGRQQVYGSSIRSILLMTYNQSLKIEQPGADRRFYQYTRGWKFVAKNKIFNTECHGCF